MRVILLFLLLLAVPAAVLIPSPVHSADQLSQTKAQLDQLKSRIHTITRQLEQDKKTQNTLDQEVEKIEQRVANLRQANKLVSRDLNLAQKKSDALERERAALQGQLKSHYKALEAQLRAAHIIGRQASTRMLLSQQDPARLARMQIYLERFQRNYQDKINVFQTTLDALQIKNEESANALAELKVLKTSQQQALHSIESQRASRRKLLDEVQARLGAGGGALRDLRNQQSKLEKLVENLAAAVQKSHLPSLKGRFVNNKGQLIRPVTGKTLATYGSLKADGETRWQGLWLEAKAGNPVQAIANGRVVYVGWMHHYGLLVVLDHGDGWFSLYGHSQSASASVGDEVEAGQTITAAGDTGGQSKSGVYLEIRNGRKTHNPSRWLRASNL